MFVVMHIDKHLKNIDISLLKSKKSTLATYWKMENDNTHFARLYYIKQGSGFIRTFGKEYQLVPGRIYLVPPRGNLAYGFIDDLEIWWVHFTATVLSQIDLFDYLTYDVEIEPAVADSVEQKMERLIELVQDTSIGSQIAGNGLLLEILSLFLKNSTLQLHSEQHDRLDRFIPVVDYIESHLGEKITTETLAEIAHYERSHFSVMFKKLFDIAPIQYINRKRVDGVQLMLQSTSRTLDELADEYGFSDAFHLSKVFKQYTGQSPRDFRKLSDEIMP